MSQPLVITSSVTEGQPVSISSALT